MSAIQEENIKFLASQVMDDVPEGGGAATSNEIVDGQLNNVFPDTDDQDRAMGRFRLRKLFLAVRTLNTDRFGSARTVVTGLPQDPAISYTVFSTKDPFDTRAQASSRVEAFLFKGGMWPGALYENHISGMRQVRVIQRVDSELPTIGKTLCLVQNEGQQDEIEQYIRITDVSVSRQTFTTGSGQDFDRWIVTLSLSDRLRHNFDGFSVSMTDSYNYEHGARLRDTTVADATKYYGGQYSVADAAVGDQTLNVESIFNQLVPSAQTETPLVNQPLNPELSIKVSAGSREVDIPQQAHTLARQVTAANRRLNWVETLTVAPAAESLSLSYMAQGNWYTLVDDGSGIIAGSDPAFGSGTLDYETKALSVTLGALPDVGSMVLFTWGSTVHYQRLSGDEATNAPLPEVHGELPDLPVDSATVVFEWKAGGAAKRATCNALGIISGDGEGSVDGTTGRFVLKPYRLPDRGVQLQVQCAKFQPQNPDDVVRISESIPVAPSLVFSQEPEPSTFRLLILVSLYGQKLELSAHIESNEVWVQPMKFGEYHVSRQRIGTIESNIITLERLTCTVLRNSWSSWDSSWSSSANIVSFSAEMATATYVVKDVPKVHADVTHEQTISDLQVALAATEQDRGVANSMEFTVGGRTYQDRAGTVVTDIDPVSGSAMEAGSMDYSRNIATLRYWDGGGNASVSVSSLLTVYGEWTATEGVFRAASSPLKPESLQITGTAMDGEQLTAMSNADGEFVSEYIQGEADYTLGVGSVSFGKWVSDDSLSEEEKAEPWYDPANVDSDGNIYKPRPMLPSTLRYNAVSYRYLPLDADIVGIDAVRLPPDGRVPIYRPGDLVMVMHAQSLPAQSVADGDVVATRPRVAWVRIHDANDNPVNDGYELDRASGEITVTDMASVPMPITIQHTVADLRMLSDVQISGELTVSRALTHNFPAGETVVASCLPHGDRRARVSTVWDQETWNETWTDGLQGREAIASLNVIAHPITVTNEGAETERWALRWRSATQVELIGERIGLVYTGPFSEDIAPINPRTRNEDGSGGVPYLTIPAAANGGGWNTGNVVRINTVGAIADFWIAQGIQQSDVPLGDGLDGCEIHGLGNIDRP
ncbi:hypothetical protein [Marinobacter xestospongiae]|uniref:hypothetical protein n=1 Tax=Marinobacter xestospongiae TaxID=994319 RepID=UPI0020055CF0|nr:hypothetical protein [Marinobacter xestospongiae]MCK7566709.1 hypothetical protein [Marinobacter xestospongiae]